MPRNITREKKKEIKKPDLFLADYTDRSFIVTGETIDHKDALVKLKGTFNPNLKIGAGWIFSKARKESVQKYIDTGKIEPFIFDKSKFGSFQKKETNFEPVFKDLELAFDSDKEYTGESVLDLISQIKEKYYGKKVVKLETKSSEGSNSESEKEESSSSEPENDDDDDDDELSGNISDDENSENSEYSSEY